MDINLLAIIINFQANDILYVFLCASKEYNNNLLNHLEILDLKNNNIYNYHLKKLKNIKILILKNNKNITDNGLNYLINAEYLDLSKNKNITNIGINYLVKIKKLNLSWKII